MEDNIPVYERVELFEKDVNEVLIMLPSLNENEQQISLENIST